MVSSVASCSISRKRPLPLGCEDPFDTRSKKQKYVTLKRKDTETLSSFFVGRCVVPQPFLPFRIIKAVASKALESFIVAATKFPINSRDGKTSDRLRTSCTNTSRSIAWVFFDQEAEKISLLLNKFFAPIISIPLRSGKKCTYKANDLFGGPLILEMEKRGCRAFNLKNAEDYQAAMECIHPYLKDFSSHIQSKIEQVLGSSINDSELTEEAIATQLEQVIKSTDYKFNLYTINSLRDEIQNNKQRVRPDCSFVYWITILAPASHDHMFLIEQFYQDGNVRFHFYQSWILQATIMDEWEKQKAQYGSEIWDEFQMENFLETFHNTINSGKTEAVNYESCFGYPRIGYPLLNFQNQTLLGISVRYISRSIHPSDCIQHVIDLVRDNPELHAALTND